MRGVHPWFMLSRVLVRSMQTQIDQDEVPEGILIRKADRSDLLAALQYWPASALSSSFIHAASERGDICIAAFWENRLVAFVWRSFTTAPHTPDIYVEVQPPYWYTYKMMTHPEFRGEGLGGMLTRFGDRFCAGSDCHSGVGFIETHNYSSLRANMKIGSRCVGFAGYIKIFGRPFTFRTRGVVAHTFRFVRHNGAYGR